MWAVFQDEETMELLDAAAEMAAASLAARSRRVDEDGVLRRSSDMSRIKLHTLRQSFHQAPLIEFHELEPNDAVQVYNLCHALREAETLGQRDAIWKTLRTLMLRPGKKKPFSGGSEPWSDPDLPKPGVSRGAKRPSSPASDLPDLRREQGDGSAPQKASKRGRASNRS